MPGCHSVGPGTVAAGRLDYSTAIAESWKRQTLLNIVKLRYMDTPIFVDVGQIVSGYSLETGLSGTAVALPHNGTFDQLQLQGSSKFTDRPTITSVPLTGSRFIQGLMTPIPPDALFSAIQSGWPADVLLRLVVSSINGLKNDEGSLGGRGAPDADFVRMADLMRSVQVAGALTFRVVRGKGGDSSAILVFRQKNIAPEVAEQLNELGTLLRLEPGLGEYRLVYGSVAADGREMAVLTRSLFHVIGAMSLRAEVPAADIASGRASPRPATRASDDADASDAPGKPRAPARRPFIRCTTAKPADAYTAVHYRGHWFWIDDRDLFAKREFAFIMILFTMTDSGSDRALPVLTIPAQ